jgi:hypothetical protein
MSDVVSECRSILAMAKPANSNGVLKGSNTRPAAGDRVEALLAEIVAVKVVGKTDYEKPQPMAKLIVKPTPYWRKMVTMG